MTRRLCLYFALFLPLRSTSYKEKKRKVPVVDYIFRNSLKLKSKDSETVLRVHRATEKFISLMSLFTSQKDVRCDVEVTNRDTQHAEAICGKILIDVPESSKLRIWAGLLLREIKDFWPDALLVSTLVYLDDGLHESSTEGTNLEKSRELFKLVKDFITVHGLENIWETHPLVNGNEIMSILNLKGGPSVKEWENIPAGTDPAFKNHCLNMDVLYRSGETQEYGSYASCNTINSLAKPYERSTTPIQDDYNSLNTYYPPGAYSYYFGGEILRHNSSFEIRNILEEGEWICMAAAATYEHCNE